MTVAGVHLMQSDYAGYRKEKRRAMGTLSGYQRVRQLATNRVVSVRKRATI